MLERSGADSYARWVVAAAVVVLGVGALGVGPAAAQDGYKAPFIELGLGATNITATAGNGRLTAGVSKDGDLTMMSWPSPSYWDQVHYITTNAPDARQQRRLGGPERAGVFAALALAKQGEGEPTVTFLRDWERQVTYAQDDVRIIETTYTSSQHGLEVVQRDAVAPDEDVLTRHYQVTVIGNTQYDSIDLLGYANLSPGQSKVPQIPLLDVLMDHKNDFLGVWHDPKDAIVHFQPDGDWVVDEIEEGIDATAGTIGRKFGPLGNLLKPKQPKASEIERIADRLDSAYSQGVYAAMGASPTPAGHQIGEDPTDFCAKLDEIADNITELQQRRPNKDLPADPSVADLVRCRSFDPLQSIRDEQSWEYSATDAFDDLKDGQLEGNDLAGAQVNTALRVPVSLSGSPKSGEATLYFAFGETATKSLDTLDWARSQGADAIEQSVIDNDEAIVDGIFIPEEVTGDLRKFIKRAFLNLLVGTDDESGAIVASISRQPSYQLDWPRDGAFFNTALDLAGLHELVSKRMDFYSQTMRKEQKDPFPLLNGGGVKPGWPDKPSRKTYPPHSWEMNYYADGMVGGNIRLEIDNTALLIWAYVAHVGHLPEAERADYIQKVWPTVEKATRFVASWRDPMTGLMWPANEDDHAAFTQGLQGAETSFLALVSAARMAKQVGEEELADDWLERAGELRQATLHYMADEEHGFVDYGEEEKGAAAGRAWLGWPTHFLPDDNPRMQKTLKEVLDKNLERVRGNDGNGLYPTKVAISAALTFDDEEQREKSIEIARRIAEDIANQKTWTIGETFVTVDEDGDGETDRFKNAVSTPHLWSAILVYITTVAYHAPERFDPSHDALPEVSVPKVTPPGVGAGDGDAGADAGDAGADVAEGDSGAGDDVGGVEDAGDQTPPDDEGCNCSSTQGPVPFASFGLLVIFVLAGRAVRRAAASGDDNV
mgnify:CR=1 FL=1